MDRKRVSDEEVEEVELKVARARGEEGAVPPRGGPEEEEYGGGFEDPFEDDYEEEEDYEDYEEEEEEEEGADAMEVDEEEEEEEDPPPPPPVWLPGVHALQPGESLLPDESAYDLLHMFTVEWPALSMAVLRDELGEQRPPPHTLYVALGSQAERASQNKIVLLKLSALGRTQGGGDDSDSEGFDPDAPEQVEAEGDPLLEHRDVALPGGALTRLRSCPHQPTLLAALSDLGVVSVLDVRHVAGALDAPPSRPLKAPQPLTTFAHHHEAWSLAWSPLHHARLLSGDGAGRLHVWQPLEGGRWAVDQAPYQGHQGGVEDATWSPSEPEVFASAGADGTVRLWDLRRGHTPAATWVGSSSDVNALSWNPRRAFLLASGAEDGPVRVWDLRRLADPSAPTTPQFELAWHRAPLSEVAWSPHEDSLLAASSEDGSVSLWDLAVASERTEVDGHPVPSQLVFLHAQEEVKGVAWHPHVPSLLLSTAGEGLHVWKPANL